MFREEKVHIFELGREEFVSRVRLWLVKDKNCRRCCVSCPYFEQCKQELIG